jgi:predicted DNA-binding helix-hairpin-helix protein
MTALIKKPSIEEKLNILTDSAKYDVCLSTCSQSSDRKTSGRVRDPESDYSKWLYPVNIPGKGYVHILKILQTNTCSNKCKYCIFSSEKDICKRVQFSPEELASAYMNLARKRLVHGLFLSSGTDVNPDKAMERMIKTAEILRNMYKYKDYIHLKILPGVSRDLIVKSAQLSNRISLNLEAPSQKYLTEIAPDKNFDIDMIQRMKWAGELINDGSFAKSQTTQFVIGAAGENDLEVLTAVDRIYSDLHVFRAYFSAYQSPEINMENSARMEREHRLYQCDFLLRGYGFRFKDLVFDNNGNIPENTDPKTAHALMHPEYFPVDINIAEEYDLLKVPGIGPVSAKRILAWRKENKFRSIDELKKTGAWINKSVPYISFSGRPVKEPELFDEFSLHPEIASWKTNQISDIKENKTDNYPGIQGKSLYYSWGRKDRIICKNPLPLNN